MTLAGNLWPENFSSIEQLQPASACLSQLHEKLVAADLRRAKRGHVRRHHLHVEPIKPARLQMFDQKQERELRGVRAQMKHGLARERTARVHAVETADQFVASPSLDAVRVPGLMQCAVGTQHV